MKALDTNVLVRFLVADDPAQSARVRALFQNAEEKREPLFVSIPVLLEMLWVLNAVYEIPRAATLDALDQIAGLPFLRFESEKLLSELIAAARKSNTDLADLLIGFEARNHGCSATITLDRKSTRSELFHLL